MTLIKRAAILSFLLTPVLAGWALAQPVATIYYSPTWKECQRYVGDVLEKELERAGINNAERLDYFSDALALERLQALNARLGIPPLLQSQLVTAIDERIILAGHVPRGLVREVLSGPATAGPSRLLIYQDKMEEHPSTYRLWAFQGESQEFPIDTPLSVALAGLQQPRGKEIREAGRTGFLLPTVAAAGLLDGLSPCAFAVLIFLAAFLFAIRRLRKDVLKVGLVFIGAVLVTYFLIGLGLLRVLSSLGQFHIIAKLEAYLLILLGALGVVKWLFPGFPLTLSLPRPGWERIRGWVTKATLPSTGVAGFLVGFCTLPCSGGIYLATVGLLAASTTHLSGLGYLTLYNVANIVPLLVILLVITNRPVSLRVAQWERALSRPFRGVFAVSEILLGLVILVWLV